MTWSELGSVALHLLKALAIMLPLWMGFMWYVPKYHPETLASVIDTVTPVFVWLDENMTLRR